MKFITYAEMVKDVINWDLPRKYDVIVAVPRSGIIPATVLALHRNTKLTTPRLWSIGKTLIGGTRDQRRNPQTALVLDDSLLSGRSIKEARLQLRGIQNVDYAAVYVKPGHENLVDHHCKLLEMPRIFEWNWCHHYWLQHACLDIDGVLCEDPTAKDNDDGPRYLSFIRNVRPRFVPTVQVGTLVTSRLETYRRPTEAWLAKHQICYKKLVMHPARSKVERQRMNNHAKLKAREYLKRGYRLFVESSQRQAAEIYKLTGKPVLCTDLMRIYA